MAQNMPTALGRPNEAGSSCKARARRQVSSLLPSFTSRMREAGATMPRALSDASFSASTPAVVGSTSCSL